MWSVYLLWSASAQRYYIGQTSDLTARLAQHNGGAVRSTRHGRPWQLIGFEVYPTQREARWREHQLKQHSDRRNAFIQALLAQAR